QTIVSFYAPEIEIAPGLTSYCGNGSIKSLVSILRDLLRRESFDVIHVHSGHMGAMLIAAVLPFQTQVLSRTVFTLHTSYHLLKPRNKMLVTSFMLSSAITCACSESSQSSIPGFVSRILGRRLRAVVNGYDTKRLEVLEAQQHEPRFNTECLRVVCVAALNPGKRQAAVLEALRSSQDQDIEIHFLGDGPERARLEEMAATLGSRTAVSFPGKVPRDEVMIQLLEADVFVSLSAGEGMPISVLEAMGAGCLTVLSSIPPHCEIRAPDSSVRLVDATQPGQVAQALGDFSRLSVDERKREGLVAQAHVLKNFNLQLMLEKYLAVYGEVHCAG
ncbi:MAG: glycosyltransferase family 4 protein, partial [Deltaproteobacteria bacterium]|nr:glycosyltransferase family 4 protein [Deltaproteobacteria bacterium]